jgi:hypothetical protein
MSRSRKISSAGSTHSRSKLPPKSSQARLYSGEGTLVKKGHRFDDDDAHSTRSSRYTQGSRSASRASQYTRASGYYSNGYASAQPQQLPRPNSFDDGATEQRRYSQSIASAPSTSSWTSQRTSSSGRGSLLVSDAGSISPYSSVSCRSSRRSGSSTSSWGELDHVRRYVAVNLNYGEQENASWDGCINSYVNKIRPDGL